MPIAQRSVEATALVRPPPNKAGLWIGLTAIFAVLVVGVFVLIGSPKPGRVAVSVTDAKQAALNHVEIFVDGRKFCETSPCYVDQMAAGTHEVKVLADGYEIPPARSIVVEPRRDTMVSFALLPLVAKSGTGLRVGGNQPGVKLFVDDREIGLLPQEVRDLSPGSHKLTLRGSERYQAWEKNVTIAKDEIMDLGPQTLKVLKGKATISLATPGAKVYIVSGNDRREVSPLPISVDIDTSKQWSLEASKAGFVDFKQVVSFDDGQAEKAFTVTLDAKQTPSTSGVALAPVTPDAPPRAAPPRPAAPREPPASKPAPAPPPQADNASTNATGGGDGNGTLNINSIPASSVVLDGKPIGNTPKIGVSVAPGPHTVFFVNADLGLRKSVTVTVSAGEKKTASARLRDDQ
jgi:serine/threonine-protein kinase